MDSLRRYNVVCNQCVFVAAYIQSAINMEDIIWMYRYYIVGMLNIPNYGLTPFYMQVLQQQNLLIDEQKTNEPNPLHALANITKQHVTQNPRHPL